MNNNECIAIDVLEDYLDGKLDAKTMHQIEKISLEDIFVAEALAGLSQSPKRNYSLSLLQKQLQQRVAEKPENNKRWRITSQRLSIASAAAVLFVIVSVLFWMKENNRQKQLAKQAKKVEVNLAPTVTAKELSSTTIAVEPLKGWETYQAYLTTNNRLTKQGLFGKEVELSFQVNASGDPVNIIVVKPIGEIYNQEAIRLLKEGPKWNYADNKPNKGILKVKF